MSVLRVVFDENLVGVQETLEGIAECQAMPGRDIHQANLIDADALLVRSVTRVSAEMVAGTALRFVGTATAGYEHIDQQALAANAIAFSAAPGCNAVAVADYVLAAVLAVADFWERLAAGGSLGIVGYGHVGRRVQGMFAALGVRVLVHDPWLPEGEVPASASLDEVLSADVITLHTSLHDRSPWPSCGLLSQECLSRISADSLLINASRGEVIDQNALLAACENGTAPTLVLDVWHGEPSVSAQLLNHCALGSAHIAGYSQDAKWRGTQHILGAMARSCDLNLSGRLQHLPTLPVSLGSGASLADALRTLVSQVYDIREDDRLLREVVAQPDAAKGFDALRKQYRVRRELGAVSLQDDAGNAAVTALGGMLTQLQYGDGP